MVETRNAVPADQDQENNGPMAWLHEINGRAPGNLNGCAPGNQWLGPMTSMAGLGLGNSMSGPGPQPATGNPRADG